MIGIFGDSYADPRCSNIKGELTHESWVNDLGYSVVTYGKAGTTQLWSYRKFLEHHEKYDRVIFIMTNPDRIDHVGDKEDWSDDFIVTTDLADRILQEGHWKNILNKDYWTNRRQFDLERVKAIRDFMCFNNDKVWNTYSALIQEGILSRRPDTILIPMGIWGKFDWTGMPKGSKCWEYTLLQARSLFPSQPDFSSYYNNRLYQNMSELNLSNHFTKEINQLFASHVRRALAGEGWQDWGINDILSIPHSKPWNYYYSPFTK